MNHAIYQSAFSWRYGSDTMRALWSEEEKRHRWRQAWLALAEAQHAAGLVSAEQAADLRDHVDDIHMQRAHEIEAEIRHDVMAEIKTYAEQCRVGGGIIHLGATSMDITDNAEVTRQRDALDLILDALRALLDAWAGQIDRYADTVCMGWTHLQPAEPTTVGYRLALYAQDLLADEDAVRRVRANLRGKGLKGAVGTRASYADLLIEGEMTPAELEDRFMSSLGLAAFPLAHQTYPRRQDRDLVTALADLAGTLYRFGFDLRILQSPPIGEWHEPFAKKQVGSSAMPFKRNPIRAENLDSMGRYVAAMPRIAWDNAAHSLLDRTLDDSANRRMMIPQTFLAVDEMIRVSHGLIEGLHVDEAAAAANLDRYGAFAATERVLMALGRAGADRQAMHELIREHSMAAWAAIRMGAPNPLVEALAANPMVLKYLSRDDVRVLMNASNYVGDAPQRAREMAHAVHSKEESQGEHLPDDTV